MGTRDGTRPELYGPPPIMRPLDETVRKPVQKILCPTSLVFARPRAKTRGYAPSRTADSALARKAFRSTFPEADRGSSWTRNTLRGCA